MSRNNGAISPRQEKKARSRVTAMRRLVEDFEFFKRGNPGYYATQTADGWELRGTTTELAEARFIKLCERGAKLTGEPELLGQDAINYWLNRTLKNLPAQDKEPDE